MNIVAPISNNLPKPKWVILTECPRDAMQGWPNAISTEKKITYLNTLIKTEIDIIDCGSFVSAKAIPQMADTKEVLCKIDTSNLHSKLLVIVANERGCIEAASLEMISHIGFPFSISETFQQKNTNSSIDESLKRVGAILEICVQQKKELVIYISMAFGNPYNDSWNEDLVLKWVKIFKQMGIKDVRLADTVGLATNDQVRSVTTHVINEIGNDLLLGLHLHASKENVRDKILAGLESGCYRFDTAINGIGGCPLAGTQLVGNIDTKIFIETIEAAGYYTHHNVNHFQEAVALSSTIFI